MFSSSFLKSFRILLFPFALLFGLGVLIRNWLYDREWLQSASFGLPLICVGNLAVGGTGKSPMVEYLASHFRERYRLAIVSRGYKRKTRGYALAGDNSTAIEIGDEPMQFHMKFPEIPVAVGEERLVAIPQLLHDRPETELIILDDAFQHRSIRAGLNILLTEYNNLFTRDFFLPAGDLRDARSSYRRADLIVVTKCNPDLDEQERQSIIREIAPLRHQQVFFTTIQYGTPYHMLNHHFNFIAANTQVLLVTGIANPVPLKKYLEERFQGYQMMQYSDHHIYTIDDWREIKSKFSMMEEQEKLVLTTEKDATRLMKFAPEITGMPFYVIPIEHRFLFNEGHLFNSIVANFIQNFKKPA